jgi:hypothetical protein
MYLVAAVLQIPQLERELRRGYYEADATERARRH